MNKIKVSSAIVIVAEISREDRLSITRKYPVLSFLLSEEGGRMEDLIDRNEALRILGEIKEQHARRTCSRSSQLQASAIGYAIEVVKKIPSTSSNETEER